MESSSGDNGVKNYVTLDRVVGTLSQLSSVKVHTSFKLNFQHVHVCTSTNDCVQALRLCGLWEIQSFREGGQD